MEQLDIVVELLEVLACRDHGLFIDQVLLDTGACYVWGYWVKGLSNEEEGNGIETYYCVCLYPGVLQFKCGENGPRRCLGFTLWYVNPRHLLARGPYELC